MCFGIIINIISCPLLYGIRISKNPEQLLIDECLFLFENIKTKVIPEIETAIQEAEKANAFLPSKKIVSINRFEPKETRVVYNLEGLINTLAKKQNELDTLTSRISEDFNNPTEKTTKLRKALIAICWMFESFATNPYKHPSEILNFNPPNPKDDLIEADVEDKTIILENLNYLKNFLETQLLELEL